MTTPAASTTYADLTPLVASLKRFVAVPGGFDAFFPDTTDDDIGGALADGFARAQLDGFFLAGSHNAHVLDIDTLAVSPPLALPEGALVVLYAGKRLVQTQLINVKTMIKYEAKGLIYETQQAASVLTELLKEYTVELKELVQIARRAGASRAFVMADAYFIRATGYYYGYSAAVEQDRAYDYRALANDPTLVLP